MPQGIMKKFIADGAPTYEDHHKASEMIQLPVDIIESSSEGQIGELVKNILAQYHDSKVAIEQSIVDVAVNDPDAMALATTFSERIISLIDIAAEKGLYGADDPFKINDMLNQLGVRPEARADALMQEIKNKGLKTRITAENSRTKVDYGYTSAAGYVGFSPLAVEHAAQGNLREKMYPVFMSVMSGFAEKILSDPNKVSAVNDTLRDKNAGWQLSTEAIETLKNQTKDMQRGLFSLGAYAQSRDGSRVQNAKDSLKNAVANNPQVRDLNSARIPLSEREVLSQTGSLDRESSKRVQWEAGGDVWAVDRGGVHASVTAANESGDLLVAGISGTTDTVLTLGLAIGLFDGLDKDQQMDNAVLSIAAWMVDGRNHSVHEVRTSAKTFGVAYTAGPESYQSLKPTDPTFQERLRETQAARGFKMPEEYLQAEHVRSEYNKIVNAELEVSQNLQTAKPDVPLMPDDLDILPLTDVIEAPGLERKISDSPTSVAEILEKNQPADIVQHFDHFKSIIKELRDNEAFKQAYEREELNNTVEISLAFNKRS